MVKARDLVLTFVMLILLVGCSAIDGIVDQLPGRKISFSYPIMVWQDEYVVEAEGPWCPWRPGITSCERVFSAGSYAVDDSGGVKLLRSSELSALGRRKVVPYDPKEDLCNDSELEGMACSPNYVLSIEKTPDDPLYNQLWGLHGKEGIRANNAWDLIGPLTDVMVAVIDTGVDCAHPEISCFKQYDAILDNEGEQADENGHGTHVAGTICAYGNNNLGISGAVWNCRVMAVKFLGSGGNGSLFNAVRAIDWAVQQGARVINASWGGGGFSQPLYNSIRRARDGGVLFVAAAGNNGVNTDDYPHYPSGYDLSNIISVASIANNGEKSSFSNYGKLSVDLAAPGSQILSTWTGGGYRTISGTSMATPHVSGAAALLIRAGVGDVRDRLLSTTRELKSLKGKVGTGGALDAFQAAKGEGNTVPPCDKVKLKKCKGKCDDDFVCACKNKRRCKKDCKQKWGCK
jgi:hypothetical protein